MVAQPGHRLSVASQARWISRSNRRISIDQSFEGLEVISLPACAIKQALYKIIFCAYAILARIMNVLRSLKHRPFALLWAGQTVSRFGDSLHRIALAWWVLEKTGSAAAMGTVLVLTQIPLLIFLLIGGIVVDRFPRIRIMFLSDVLSGAVVTFIAVFSWLDLLQIWHIYVASLVFGFVQAFFFPAYQSIIPQITPPDMLTSANSLNGLSGRITGIVGPSIGAALVGSSQ
jgi:DHA3 family tetracycline resistance protein-like MFS transporter